MGKMQGHHFAELRDAVDAKFDSASTHMSRQVEVLVEMKFNDLCCHKEQMLVPDSTGCQHTISSSLRDERASVAAASTAAMAAVAPAKAQETAVHDRLVHSHSAVDHIVPSKDDHIGLSSSYSSLAHRRRDFENSMSDSDCHMRLTSSYPALPKAKSYPPGCPVQPPVWKPFSLSGRDDLHSVPEGPNRTQLLRDLPEGPNRAQLLRDLLDARAARARVPYSQRATIGITGSSQGRRQHWC